MERPQLDLGLDPNYHKWTAEEKEADRQRWRRESGRIEGQSKTVSSKHLELDPDYNTWTAEEKEADRQQWRRDNGRISTLPRTLSTKQLQLDPNYQSWTAEKQEADRLRWRLENGRIFASALQESQKESPATTKVPHPHLVVLYRNGAHRKNPSLATIGEETKDPTRNSNIVKRQRRDQHRAAIKEEPESTKHRLTELESVKEEFTEPENSNSDFIKQESPASPKKQAIMPKEARIKASLERCERWFDDIEVKELLRQDSIEQRSRLAAQTANL